MEFLLIIIAVVLGGVFFLNMKRTALILCRIVGGFLFLLLYNALPLPSVGINLVTAAVCGVLEIPGWLLLLCLNL